MKLPIPSLFSASLQISTPLFLYFRHDLEIYRQKFRVIGYQWVRMKITDEVPYVGASGCTRDPSLRSG